MVQLTVEATLTYLGAFAAGSQLWGGRNPVQPLSTHPRPCRA